MPGIDEFQLVTYRKKRAANVRIRCNNLNTPESNDNNSDNETEFCDIHFGKLLEAEVELKNSSFADDVFHSLNDSLNALNANGIPEILCYGLGHFTSFRTSKYQLALLLSLKNFYGSQVYIYDPAFFNSEIKLLKRFGFNVITTNEEGKRIIKDNLTLVYMPHCPIMLTNNFLYANWSTNLKNCIFLSTSFQNIIYDMQYESNPYEYIMRIRPYITEITLQNSFTYEEIFSELNIHFFLEQSINSAPQSFWNEREEPYYFGF